MRCWALAVVAVAFGVAATAGTSAPPGDVQAMIALGRGPCCVAAAGGSIWVGVHRSGAVDQIDPHTNKVVWTMRVPPQAIDYGSLLSAYGSLWIVGRAGAVDGVSRLDPKTHALVRVRGLRHVNGLVPYAGRLWASTDDGPFVYRIDPASARVDKKLKVNGRQSYTVGATGAGGLWCAVVNSGWTSTGAGNSVTTRIDPDTAKVTAKLTPFGSGAYAILAQVRSIAAAGDAIWETQEDDGAGPGIPWTLVRIDGATGKVTARRRPRIAGAADSFPVVLSAGDGTLWLQTRPEALEQFDPQTGKTLRRLLIPLAPKRQLSDYWNSSITSAFGSYWVTVWPGQHGPADPSTGVLVRLAAAG